MSSGHEVLLHVEEVIVKDVLLAPCCLRVPSLLSLFIEITANVSMPSQYLLRLHRSFNLDELVQIPQKTFMAVLIRATVTDPAL